MMRLIYILLASVLLLGRAQAQDLALGDSIALGTGRALHIQTIARVGYGSCWVLAHTPRTSFRYVVVSAGINDPPGSCIRAIFQRIVAKRVVVILPAPINSARANVARWAAEYNLSMIDYDCAHGCTKWNFHPASYPALAMDVRRLWGLE